MSTFLFRPLSSCCFLLCLFFATSLNGAQFEEEITTQDYLFAKGVVRSVSSEDQTITLRQKAGSTVTLSIDEETIFDGFYRLSELKTRQKLKVWYRPKGETNQALKILKPLELGC